MSDTEADIRATAKRLWEEDGRPEGRDEVYRDLATEIVAQKENYLATTRPIEDTLETEEPAEVLENLGEFPTLTDQGEQQPPHRGDEG